MVFNRETIERLEAFSPAPWQGEVYRHMFARYQPDRENVGGARWNPAGVAAIYTSLTRAAALAEAEYYINLQPLRPRARRVLYRIQVRLASVLDLSPWETLEGFGIRLSDFASLDYSVCQEVGGAVDWLRHDGMLAPSARDQGTNLVIFPGQRQADYEFKVVDSEVLADP